MELGTGTGNGKWEMGTGNWKGTLNGYGIIRPLWESLGNHGVFRKDLITICDVDEFRGIPVNVGIKNI
jgi:hypothetical protein